MESKQGATCFLMTTSRLPIRLSCIKVGPTTFSANQNVTVYLLNEGSSHRPLILADNQTL
jgi:hypothetical protein